MLLTIIKRHHLAHKIALYLYRDYDILMGKKISLSKDDGSFSVAYTLENNGDASVKTDFAVELNFAMLSGNDPAKWYFTGGGDKACGLDKTADLGLHGVFGIHDERVGLQVRIQADPRARLLVHPVYTINHSESGFEKVFQCCAIYAIWPLSVEPGSTFAFSLDNYIGEL